MSKNQVLNTILALVLLLALPAALSAAVAQQPQPLDPVYRGLDLLASQPGTAADFSDNPIPNGFFGCNSGPYTSTIPLGGVPIASNQALGATDTILARWDTVSTGTGNTDLQVVGLCLSNNAWTGPCGNSWSVSARLLPGAAQPITTLSMTRTSSTGGSFNATVVLDAEVTFTNNNTGASATVVDNVVLNTSGATWKETPGPGDATASAPLTYDLDCDGTPDTTINLGTTTFFPVGTVNHDGPHPAAPAPKCQPGDVEPTQDLDDTSSTSSATTEPQPEPCGVVVYRPAQQR